MAFEYLFGIFGLISSDSRSHHRSRLEEDWRSYTPLSSNIYKETELSSGSKSPSTTTTTSSSFNNLGNQQPIFNITGTLKDKTFSDGGGVLSRFSATSSPSTSSIGSNESTATVTSKTSLLKNKHHHQINNNNNNLDSGGGGGGLGTTTTTADPFSSKKYEFMKQQELLLQQQQKNSSSPLSKLFGNNNNKQQQQAANSISTTGDSLARSGKSSGSGKSSTSSTTATTIHNDNLNLVDDLILQNNINQQEDTSSSSGLIMNGKQQQQQSAAAAALGVATEDETTEGTNKSNLMQKTKRLREIYCIIVCLFLWFFVIRLSAGLILDKSLFTLDFYYLGQYKVQLLTPILCLAIQAACVSLIFIRNNDETNWLVPFYSSKDYLIRSRSNFRPKMEDYSRRINISVGAALILAFISSISISSFLIHIVMKSEPMNPTTTTTINTNNVVDSTAITNDDSLNNSTNQISAAAAAGGSSFNIEKIAIFILAITDIIWSIYSTFICFLVSFYFNLIAVIMKSRFHGISKIIEDLAESNTTKTTNQARKITTLYLEHNEACELLDESNDFWQYTIFFTYFTYIPAYCYCLYNLFFIDFETWPSFLTWVVHTHTGFIILLISFSAAGVSSEAHAPYTSLHTLSLIQLPLDVEVNIATFLHRVRGLTIGYSCYDLFAITNASMSNTAAACASYFLIVADFSRSSVFTLAQMNGTTAGGAAAVAAGGAQSGAGGAIATAGAAAAKNYSL